MTDEDNEMFLTCHECGRVNLVKRARSIPIDVTKLPETQHAVLEQHADGHHAFCAQCFDRLATIEGWRRQPGFELAMARLAKSFQAPCVQE